jgi:arylsulfatase A-like enzyme/Flp pilus assembly protein TadD
MVRRLWAVLLLFGCGRAAEQPRPPVILISVDTLRSDRLPMYGYRKVDTPHLDALRRDSILYERAYSHCPMTLPSHASMFTGLLPTENGVRNNLGDRLDGAKFPTLARRFRDRGYRTAAAVSSYVLRAETGIADGFDVYDDEVEVRSGGAASEHQRSGFETVKHAQTWIAQNAAQPFFFFLHIYEPHAPYTPPEPFKSRYPDAYDGEVAASDAIVGKLIEALKGTGLYDRSTIIFTSDHGEALWEHGEDQHGILVYRGVLQVPLLVKRPRSQNAGTTSGVPIALRSIHDLALGNATPARAIYSETIYPRIHLGWSELRSLIDGKYHYIESSRPELYDLDSDSSETTNLIATERRVAAAMREALQSFPAPPIRVAPVDPEEARKLAALGYIGTAQNRTGPLPNPRDQIGDLKAIRDAFRLASERRYDAAIAAMRALLEKNPRLLEVSSRLGEVLAESGRYEEAIAVYQSAMARAERFSPETAIALANAYLGAERPAEARTHAELALQASPGEAHAILARAAIEEGRLAEAAGHVRLAPENPLLTADLQRAQGNLEGALQTLAAVPAETYGLEHRRADLLARLDRPAEAVAAYEREIARFPQHLQSYANLAIIHMIEGRKPEAARVLERMAAANPHRGAYQLAAKTLEAFDDRAGAAAWRRRPSPPL